jgi:hypothetical protein
MTLAPYICTSGQTASPVPAVILDQGRQYLLISLEADDRAIGQIVQWSLRRGAPNSARNDPDQPRMVF